MSGKCDDAVAAATQLIAEASHAVRIGDDQLFPLPLPLPIGVQMRWPMPFAHEKLDVYILALDLLALADEIVADQEGD